MPREYEIRSIENDALDELLITIKIFNEENVQDITRGIGRGMGYFENLNEILDQIINIIKYSQGSDSQRFQIKYCYNKLKSIKEFYSKKNLNIYDLICSMIEQIEIEWKSISATPL